ncbi:MAG: RNA polymerase sigma factor region1.1 domain-containing protein [Gemmataceae bacterium]
MHLLEETVRLLVERGQKTGFVTFGQVHEALTESDHDPDRLDQILTSLEEAGISVIDDRDD